MEDNYIIKTNGVRINSVPVDCTGYQLKELQSIVGGLIEILELSGGMIMVINEEGKFTCEPNIGATLLAKISGAISPQDYICGNVLVCHSELVK